MPYVITTDTMADLPVSYLDEHQIERLSLTYLLDGATYNKDNSLPSEAFYQKMREGAKPITSQFNPEDALVAFRHILEMGADILHISFSSGLSGSYNSACVAAEELKREFPQREIQVVDTLAASLGEGLLVSRAIEMREAGAELHAVRDFLEENKLHLCHIFTVDDLIYLYRGGRIPRTTALLGGALNIKPVMHMDDAGHLVPFSKVRGRKKALKALVDAMEKQMGAYREMNKTIFISHGDCLADAQLVADMVRERLGFDSFLIDFVGPTIGAHSGPGTVALFFFGEYR